MENPEEILNIFKKYIEPINNEIKTLLKSQNEYLMYDMMSYFFGFKDENLKEVNSYGGKRFRSGICLLLSDMYGCKDRAIEIAASIEIFHNFTLIHDDIEDRDSLRRGKPTLWKLWGVNHGINTGDAQMILANLELTKAITKKEPVDIGIIEYVNSKYLEVTEGQFLDFTLENLQIDNSDVSEENYINMISKKSAILVGASTVSSGYIAGKKDNEKNNLWEYGFNLGLAYQLRDDLASIWDCKERTGKDECKDIKEKKKTLPIIYLYRNADKDDKNIIVSIYKKENVSEKDVEIIKGLLEKYNVYSYVWKKTELYFDRSVKAIDKLDINEKNIEILRNVNHALITDVRNNK